MAAAPVTVKSVEADIPSTLLLANDAIVRDTLIRCVASYPCLTLTCRGSSARGKGGLDSTRCVVKDLLIEISSSPPIVERVKFAAKAKHPNLLGLLGVSVASAEDAVKIIKQSLTSSSALSPSVALTDDSFPETIEEISVVLETFMKTPEKFIFISLVYGHVAHGSLRDVIRSSGKESNPNTKSLWLKELDKYRIAYEIARVIVFLHSHNINHNKLKASNILLDDKLSVRLTGYIEGGYTCGATHMYQQVHMYPLQVHSRAWQSPDVLREVVAHWEESISLSYTCPPATCVARDDSDDAIAQLCPDSYSFGILICELFSMSDPFRGLVKGLTGYEENRLMRGSAGALSDKGKEAAEERAPSPSPPSSGSHLEVPVLTKKSSHGSCSSLQIPSLMNSPANSPSSSPAPLRDEPSPARGGRGFNAEKGKHVPQPSSSLEAASNVVYPDTTGESPSSVLLLFANICLNESHRPTLSTTYAQIMRRIVKKCTSKDKGSVPNFRTILEDCVRCRLQMEVSDVRGSALWKKEFLPHFSVRWSKFITGLYTSFELSPPDLLTCPPESQAVQQLQALRAILMNICGLPIDNDPEHDFIVTARNFNDLLQWFGPLQKLESLLSAVDAIVRKPWFHGCISGKEADKRLLSSRRDLHGKGSAHGLFLVRFSESEPGSYAISAVNRGEACRHYRVHHGPNLGYLVFGQTKRSLDEVVFHMAGELSLQRPCKGSEFEEMFQKNKQDDAGGGSPFTSAPASFSRYTAFRDEDLKR